MVRITKRRGGFCSINCMRKIEYCQSLEVILSWRKGGIIPMHSNDF